MGGLRSTEKGDQLEDEPLVHKNPPEDKFHVAYMIYFLLGTGYLLPWNAFITAVDYFAYLYPNAHVGLVFPVAYDIPSVLTLTILIKWSDQSSARLRINLGLCMFLVLLATVPIMDAMWIDGHKGLNGTYYTTVAAVGFCGIADGLVEGTLIGSAGELPERYMQAVIGGTAASGKLEAKEERSLSITS
eukprot:Gb_12126 [translate_table: standard]